MRLGVNGWRILGKRTGVGRYVLDVVRNWTPDVVAGRFDEITLYVPAPLDTRALGIPDTISVRVLRPNVRMLAWENLRFGPCADDDVTWSPSYSRPLVARGATVVTIHEATLRLFPNLYPLSARLPYARLYEWSGRHATLVLTHTKACRTDIVTHYGVPDARMRVVSLAPAECFVPPSDRARASARAAALIGRDVPFFLHVGKFTPRRNTPKLIEAFGRFKGATRAPHALVVIGLNNLHLDMAALARRHGVEPDLVHRDYIGDDDLAALYGTTQAFVLPYTYEAVSLTALEAQACGAPAIVTDTPGLREQTGGVALYMPTAEVAAIEEAMTLVAADGELRERLSRAGVAHASRFTTRRSASETLQVLAEAATLRARTRGTVAATP